jgi:phage transcriptional regulator, ArpU family
MVEQLSFKLPEIDREETRKRVEEALEACKLYMQIGYHPGHEPKVTPSYSVTPPSRTNAFHSSTEETACRNVDEEARRRQVVERVWGAVNRLSHLEREIIVRRYLADDPVLDYELWDDLNLSERKYYRIKARAFYKLALALRLEVYIEDQPSKVAG